MASRQQHPHQPISNLAVVLDGLERAEQAALAGDREAAVSALGRVRDKLLGLDSL
jgi:hypothetical protein